MFCTRKDIKLSFSKPKFQTNGNKIICKLNYHINIPNMFLAEPYMVDGKIMEDAAQVQTLFDLGLMHTATGKAVCSSSDEFDKKTGRAIAVARAEAKAYKHAKLLVRKHIKYVVDFYNDAVLAFEAKADSVQRHNKEYVEEKGK